MSISPWEQHEDEDERADSLFEWPKISDHMRRWLGQYLITRKGICDVPAPLRPRVQVLMLDWALEYLRWSPETVYRGPGYSMGRWEVEPDQFLAALKRATETARLEMARTADAPHHASLDAWLRADLEGRLQSIGPTGGSDKLPGYLKARLEYSARRRQVYVCRECGEQFHQKRSVKQRTCSSCLDLRRVRKESRNRHVEQSRGPLEQVDVDPPRLA